MYFLLIQPPLFERLDYDLLYGPLRWYNQKGESQRGPLKSLLHHAVGQRQSQNEGREKTGYVPEDYPEPSGFDCKEMGFRCFR